MCGPPFVQMGVGGQPALSPTPLNPTAQTLLGPGLTTGMFIPLILGHYVYICYFLLKALNGDILN